MSAYLFRFQFLIDIIKLNIPQAFVICINDSYSYAEFMYLWDYCF